MKILSRKKICNGACDEVIYTEAGHKYTAVLSPHSGIISVDNGEYSIIGDCTRDALLKEIG